MKITLRYEEASTEDLHMTLRLTLPQKYLNGTNKEVVKLFVDHYNKKNAEKSSPLSTDDLHLKIVGGDHLDNEERVRESLKAGDECYLLGKDSEGPKPKPEQAEGYQAAPVCTPVEKKALKNADGKLRCKNFGCQKLFDPDGPPQECQHHKAAPIFHETAKWWSCCPDSKAYDFDEFMKIPGCTQGFCTNESQAKKRFLGGTDLRADTSLELSNLPLPSLPFLHSVHHSPTFSMPKLTTPARGLDESDRSSWRRHRRPSLDCQFSQFSPQS